MQVNIAASILRSTDNKIELVKVVTRSAFDLLLNGHVIAARFRSEEEEDIWGCPNCVTARPSSHKFCFECGSMLKSNVPKTVIDDNKWIILRWHGGQLYESTTNPLYQFPNWSKTKMHLNYFMKLHHMYYVKEK